MKRKAYITDEEREKCRRVAEAFAELYELVDTVVVDAGRYGFIKLQYYKYPGGFDSMVSYTDSREMFEDLWQDWFDEQVISQAIGTPLEELNYEDIFKCLPERKQVEIMEKRNYFEEKSRSRTDEIL